ncbi:hypothetical protein B0T24DRAFT_378867 [Lasiosphaeria ovina]|uniref:Uncharacterized protein n=1 Tax=Lasiosphaeria ovina TaxID=92902 RepID=A0AAE0N2I0_9PEZI|nr:hypothetical protein B0T24DRAFT_378867 [Lasiosphaeria ovina]
MCHTTRFVYTVCTHDRVEETKCEARQAAESSSKSALLSWFSTRPSKICAKNSTKTGEAVMGFCAGCRAVFKGHNTRNLTAIKNYWAYKNTMELLGPVSAHEIPADVIFGRPIPEDPTDIRFELTALVDRLTYFDSDTMETRLRRAQKARVRTIKWASSGPESTISADRRSSRASVQIRGIAEVLDIPPRAAQRVSNSTSEDKPNAHLETLEALCGDAMDETEFTSWTSKDYSPTRESTRVGKTASMADIGTIGGDITNAYGQFAAVHEANIDEGPGDVYDLFFRAGLSPSIKKHFGTLHGTSAIGETALIPDLDRIERDIADLLRDRVADPTKRRESSIFLSHWSQSTLVSGPSGRGTLYPGFSVDSDVAALDCAPEHVEHVTAVKEDEEEELSDILDCYNDDPQEKLAESVPPDFVSDSECSSDEEEEEEEEDKEEEEDGNDVIDFYSTTGQPRRILDRYLGLFEEEQRDDSLWKRKYEEAYLLAQNISRIESGWPDETTPAADDDSGSEYSESQSRAGSKASSSSYSTDGISKHSRLHNSQ